MAERLGRAERHPGFAAPFVWAAIMSVGTILAVVVAMWLMMQ
jgi:hypothetical protein